MSEIKNARILIVDDLEANVFLLEQVLEGADYTNVTSTRDPHSVCDLHRDNRYDLILLDLQMPDMDGFQVMENLKRIEPDSYVPVLVITAQPEHKLRALKAGAKDFISKPFDLLEVKTRIANMLEVRLLYKKIEYYSKTLEQTVQERTEELRRTNEQLLQEIDQHKETEVSLRNAYEENNLLKEQLQAENNYLHKDISFQEQLVRDLSHQLRTPLTSMRGGIELALHKSRSVEKYQGILENTISGIDRMTALLNTMLSLAKLDGHIEHLVYSRYNLVTLAQETIEELAALWEEKSIHLKFCFFRKGRLEEFEIKDGVTQVFPEFVHDSFTIDLDVFRMKQAIINILDNAYKYTPVEGRIRIEFYREVRGDVEICRFIIMDNGPAIPADTLSRLFIRFFQVDIPQIQSDERTAGFADDSTHGFGLGLSICRRIVEMHQGSIRAFNPANGGAAFEIILPVSQVPKDSYS